MTWGGDEVKKTEDKRFQDMFSIEHSLAALEADIKP